MEIDRRKIPQYLMIAAIVGVVVFFNVSYFSDYVSANNEEIVDYALSDDDINQLILPSGYFMKCFVEHIEET